MRYNIFYDVHTPLRLALLKGCIQISNGAGSNRFKVIKAIEEALLVFEEQQRFEEDYILPLVFEYEPSIAANYSAQHCYQVNLWRKLKAAVEFYNKKQYKKEIIDLNYVLQAFNEFVITNYGHMDEEEETLNHILWIYYEDNFLKQLQQKSILLSAPVQERQHSNLIMTVKAA